MLKIKDIQRVHVELTTRCNARCPMCPRNYRGHDYNSGYPVTELLLADFKKIFPSDFLKQLVSHTPQQINYNERFGITFNGNLGDFASARDAVEIVEYCVEHNIDVSICTNGSLRQPQWWAKLAHPGVEIGFALDGLEDTHSLYRQDTEWHRVIENAQAFIAAGGQAVWRFVPFDHNRHQEHQCRQLSQQLGFYRFENIYDGRDRGPVFSRQGEFSHHIGEPYTDPAHTPDIRPLLQSHVTWFDASTIQCDKDQPNTTISCLHKKRKEIYVAADGSVYPCCFLGFYPGTMQHPGNSQLKPLVTKNNALEHGLEQCVEWFDSVESTWAQPSIQQGRLYQCVNSCGQTLA